MIEESETYSAKAEVSNVRKRRTRWERIWLDLKKAPPTAILGIVLSFFMHLLLFLLRYLPLMEKLTVNSNLICAGVRTGMYLELIKLVEISYLAYFMVHEIQLE